MKLIRKAFVVLLALAATFSSCTKDEQYVQEEVQIQNGEFVGAKLLGTGLAINVDLNNGTDTKVTETGNFEEKDKLGLGWVVSGNYNDLQVGTADPTSADLYANHLYRYINGEFVSYGNMYEGWHFAYYPYAYQPKLAEPLEVTINPAQTYSSINKEKFENGLFISPLAFVTEAENLNNADKKLENVVFNPIPAKKTIKVGLTPVGELVTSNELKSLKIESVKIQTNKPAFCSNVPVKLNVHELASYDAVEEAKEGAESDEEANAAANEFFYNKLFNEVWDAANLTRVSSITTEIDSDEPFLLGENHDIRFFTLPVADIQLNMNKVFLVIEVENGTIT
ncbi:MAG: hypothetical protein IIW11_05380, partial [Bacteroidales bacterium]|nr:hypothetical protein [Bacteroidales bacterium]